MFKVISKDTTNFEYILHFILVFIVFINILRYAGLAPDFGLFFIKKIAKVFKCKIPTNNFIPDLQKTYGYQLMIFHNIWSNVKVKEVQSSNGLNNDWLIWSHHERH